MLGDGLLAAQQRVHLGLPEAPVAPRSADAADPARGGPPGDRPRVDPEEGGDLSWGQQALARALHVFSPPLSRSRRWWTVYQCGASRPISPSFSITNTVRCSPQGR